MSPEQFHRWSALLSEAVLLVSKNGRVDAASNAVRNLGLEPEYLEQRTLFELSSTPADQLRELLRRCASSPQPTVTAITLWNHERREVRCRCDGMLAQHEIEGKETTLLLKLTPKETSVRQYRLINDKITELNREIERRVALEEELHERSRRLQRSEAILAGQKHGLELLVNDAPLADVLDALCEVIEGQSDQALIATVLLLDEDGKRLRSTAGRRVPDAYSQAVDGIVIGPAVGSCGTAAFRGEQVIVDDIETDPLWADFRELAVVHGLRACWSTPIFSSARRVLGTFAVYALQPRQPTSDQLNLIDVLARTAGIAVERRRDEEALRESDRRKDEFLATLAHELRNPLAPIRTGLEVMKLFRDDADTIEEVRQTMERQTQQLITLVDDLLDVSRITRGKFELRKSQIELADVLQSAIEASRPFIDEAGHHFDAVLPDAAIPLNADPHRLAQVISNLLNNAAKYTPDGGRICLQVAQSDDSVVIAVKDNGIGIPADMRHRIFEMFAQIDHSADKTSAGLGIGLTLVKSLVELHGGEVSVESDGPNRGSTFQVRLPTAQTFAQTDQGPATVEPLKLSRRVLVVDDNQAAAEMLGKIVRALGNEVRQAGDGREAIEIAADFCPHVILMDIGMPRMDGYEAARYIRGQSWGKDIKLVALTGWGQEEDKRRTRQAGFDLHLVKPADPSQLERILSDPGNA